MMTDPIADMLTRIRNAQFSRHTKVVMPFSKLKKNIAEILSIEGYLGKVSVSSDSTFLEVELKYVNKEPAIQEIKRESKPGHRVYKKADELPRILNGLGLAIISTSQGLMTVKDAKKAGLGGEVICSVF